MCDCFPKSGGHIPVSEVCKAKTGYSEYGTQFKQWPEPVVSASFSPSLNVNDVCGNNSSPWKQRYSFSKGARFGIPP